VSFGVYVHVPWCRSRCGYCDFNTYVPRGDEPAGFAATAIAEVALMHTAVGPRRPETVFFGGGTPTLLAAADLERVLAALDPAPGAEVTVECNPETVDAGKLADLRAAGFTRISIGMQSACAHVLATLERAHTPGDAVRTAREARAAGFGHVSLDLIYGTPGESDDDWRASLEAALGAEPDHVSAYALTLEPGTRLAKRIHALDEDALARRYETADAVLTAAGLAWYEVSNWARTPADHCRHNLMYWNPNQGDWWAIGPGAHGHIGGTRFWTHRHPAAHARAVHAGELPIAGRETLDASQRELETTMLGLRTRSGLPAARFDAARVATLRADGLVRDDGDRLVLTLRGRRLADGVVRALA
jgi:putative oxygen-independent coproporphyrinogen III oxidase